MTNTNTEMTSTQTRAKRFRRSSEEARAARLEREAALAEKAKARADRFAEMSKKALDRQQRALDRQQQITSGPVRSEKPEHATINESVAKRISKELAKFIKDLGHKNNIDFSAQMPRLLRNGEAMSIRISGQGHATVAMKAAKNAIGATREAVRFMQNYQLIGVKPNILGKEVQLAGSEGHFKVLGLKGRAHDVVLLKIDDESVISLPANDFKNRMVRV